MYSFRKISSDELNKFSIEHKKGHIFQTSLWGDLKTEWLKKFIGGFDERGNMVLACMLMLRKIPSTGKYLGYAPRGFICDFSNEELVKNFTDFLKSYGRENHVAFITIDPDIHLAENEKPTEYGEKIKNMLINLGYKHKDSKNFEGIQPNFVFRLNLDPSKDKEDEKKEIYEGFTSKTRYNIKVAEDRGLTCEVYDKDNINDEILDKFQELMEITGKRDNFIVRRREYFKDMIDKLYPYCRIYMIKYNYDKDFKRLTEKFDAQQKNLERFKNKKERAILALKDETDESKIERNNKKLSDAEKNIEESERQIKGFEERIKEIEQYKDEKNLYVSGSVYLYFGGKGWYLYGASHNTLRDAMPNFLMQWSMIQDTIDMGGYMYDFRGVSGDLNPDNPLYGLYKFKKGFNGNFVEFIGEYDLVIDEFLYKMFKSLFPKFKEIRNKIRNR